MIECKDGAYLAILQNEVIKNSLRQNEILIQHRKDDDSTTLLLYREDAIKLADLILEMTKEPDF